MTWRTPKKNRAEKNHASYVDLLEAVGPTMQLLSNDGVLSSHALLSGKGIKGPSFQVPSSSIISPYFPVCLPMPQAPSLRPVRRASNPYPIDLIRLFLRATSSMIDSLMASEGGFDDQPQPNLFGSQDFPIIIVDPEADIPVPPAQPPLLAPVPVTSSSFRFLSPEFHLDSPRGPPHPDSPVFRPASPPFLIGNPGTID